MEDICIMKKLVSDFVDTFRWEPGYYPLDSKKAAETVEYFGILLDEDYWPSDHDE